MVSCPALASFSDPDMARTMPVSDAPRCRVRPACPHAAPPCPQRLPVTSSVSSGPRPMPATGWPLRALLHDDITYTVPQTRERLVGADAFVRFLSNGRSPGAVRWCSCWPMAMRWSRASISSAPEPPATGISFFRLRVVAWPRSRSTGRKTTSRPSEPFLTWCACRWMRPRGLVRGRVLVAETGQSSLPLAAG